MSERGNATIINVDLTMSAIIKAYEKINLLNKKLKIAVEALESIRKNNRFCDTDHSNLADDALIEIEEIENENNPTNS